jgi:hypothetical protein
MDTSKYISALLNSREQAHTFHLGTSSYAQHKALEDYYNGIVPLVDSYVEAYQGTYNKLVRGIRRNSRFMSDPKKALVYFVALRKRLRKMRTAKPSHLRNIQDEITQLVSSTIYKLRFLK